MRKAGFMIIGFVVIVTGMSTVFAHQPRIVEEDVVTVDRPEVSQAFYADLAGNADEYKIESEKDFQLHVSLLVPDLPNVRTDFVADVFRLQENDSELIDTMDGGEHTWEKFFEPFAGDRYFQGPEISRQVPAGEYKIQISNPANKGKYVLGIGKEDSYSAADIVKTIRRLPQVKSYFEKSPWTALFNLIGLFILLSLCAAAGIIYGIYRIIAMR